MPHEVSRKSSVLKSKSLDNTLKLYSLTAITAGVSVLAMAQPAASEVIITKKTIPIPISEMGDGPTVKISLANNGVNDFSFSLYSFAYHDAVRDFEVRSLEGGAVVTPSSAAGSRSALALARGAKIGPSAHFSSGKGLDLIERSVVSFYKSSRSTYIKNFTGNWGGNPTNRYLGVRFLIHGKTHYGWVRLTVTTAPRKPISATITAYAYETVANKKIQAGIAGSASASEAQAHYQIQTPALGMLALGADGMALWRRDNLTIN